MKTLVMMLAAFLLCGAVMANDMHVVYTDSIAPADTVAASFRIDTTYSSWYDLRGLTRMQFWVGLFDYDGSDTNWVNDTFFVYLQHGPRKSATDARTVALDTLVDVGTALGWDEFELLRTDSLIGNWGRVMMIHWDSLEADSPDIVNNTYRYKAVVWTAQVY